MKGENHVLHTISDTRGYRNRHVSPGYLPPATHPGWPRLLTDLRGDPRAAAGSAAWETGCAAPVESRFIEGAAFLANLGYQLEKVKANLAPIPTSEHIQIILLTAARHGDDMVWLVAKLINGALDGRRKL
jgi:hypothetical protein